MLQIRQQQEKEGKINNKYQRWKRKT